MDEKITKLFLPLLDKLYNTEPAGEPFRNPVDVVKYGCYDYYSYVKHPIDLSTIRTRLVERQYKDAWRFIADIQLMFSNAYLFNKKGTPVYEYTNKLNKIWTSEVTPIMQRLNYCCGTLHKFGPQLLFCHGTTSERYCQIPIGAKYKCYQDKYSFCIPCFNKIETESINIQGLSCETTRMQLPKQPVLKSDFVDCTNDNWQYETFIQCTQCSRRVHQICDIYPAGKDEIERCFQHDRIEQEQKLLCQVPEQYRVVDEFENSTTTGNNSTTVETFNLTTTSIVEPAQPSQPTTTTTTPFVGNPAREEFITPTLSETSYPVNTTNASDLETKYDSFKILNTNNDSKTVSVGSRISTTAAISLAATSAIQTQATTKEEELLHDELLQFALNVAASPPSSPNPNEESSKSQVFECAKEGQQKSHDLNQSNSGSSGGGSDNGSSKSGSISSISNGSAQGQSTSTSPIPPQTPMSSKVNNSANSLSIGTTLTGQAKNSVDNIAARLSINKLTAEAQTSDENYHQKQDDDNTQYRDKYLCNHCYRKKKIGFNLRHRKFSARRLPHTRMSKYIETKVNEHIRENSPTAGEVTIRVLTAYRDTVQVQQRMKDYVERCRQKNPTQQHPNLNEYPNEFGYTNRAIFAWQEIDNVDVCVFGMHVQEYGEDCPEPNRQVIYLSYLDSVHFFRPKQVRTAVYHEILLSYFKYVKKLGFRRVFIWVCPSRKGDDYIFYRHPTEQKMPTLRRLSDWYVNLLDKGIAAGIVERHQNIYQYVATQNWNSILSMPYLSGDYWPGEFERLLQIMIDYEKEYEAKTGGFHDLDYTRLMNTFQTATNNGSRGNDGFFPTTVGQLDQFKLNNSSTSDAYNKKQPPDSSNGKYVNFKNSTMQSLNLKPINSQAVGSCFSLDGDFSNNPCVSESVFKPEAFTPDLDLNRSDSDQPLDLSKSSSNNSPESYFDEDSTSESSCRTLNNRRKKRKSAMAGYTRKRGRSSSQNLTSNTRGRQNTIINDRFNSQPTASKITRQKSCTQYYKESILQEALPLHPKQELLKCLERSLKRQKEGFIVARLNDCDCSPHYESQRRKEEVYISCDLMKGREPFLQLTRQKNYEFSTLRRAKFSSLAMVRHLGEYFKLEPICNECYSFDSSKRHLTCTECHDYYLCTSCHENTQHAHTMCLIEASTLPDIDEFLQQCSLASSTNSISSASSTISNKSFNDTTMELSPQSSTTLVTRKSLTTTNSSSVSGSALNRHLSNTLLSSSSSSSTMPLSCHRHKNRNSSAGNGGGVVFGVSNSTARCEDEENANICSFDGSTKPNLPEPPPSHSANNIRNNNHLNLNNFELDHVLIENFRRHAEVTYDLDFDMMKHESRKLLTHYSLCNVKETCHKCKFVVLSCSFMSALMRNTNMQMMMVNNCQPSEILPNNISNSNLVSGGVNLTTAHQFSCQSKDK